MLRATHYCTHARKAGQAGQADEKQVRASREKDRYCLLLDEGRKIVKQGVRSRLRDGVCSRLGRIEPPLGWWCRNGARSGSSRVAAPTILGMQKVWNVSSMSWGNSGSDVGVVSRRCVQCMQEKPWALVRMPQGRPSSHAAKRLAAFALTAWRPREMVQEGT